MSLASEHGQSLSAWTTAITNSHAAEDTVGFLRCVEDVKLWPALARHEAFRHTQATPKLFADILKHARFSVLDSAVCMHDDALLQECIAPNGQRLETSCAYHACLTSIEHKNAYALEVLIDHLNPNDPGLQAAVVFEALYTAEPSLENALHSLLANPLVCAWTCNMTLAGTPQQPQSIQSSYVLNATLRLGAELIEILDALSRSCQDTHVDRFLSAVGDNRCFQHIANMQHRHHLANMPVLQTWMNARDTRVCLAASVASTTRTKTSKL